MRLKAIPCWDDQWDTIVSGHDMKSVWKMLPEKTKPHNAHPFRIWSRWHRLGIHYECILSSLITLFVGLIAVLLKTGWAGGSFVPELMMSLCDRAGCEGWGHWNRLRRAAVRVLVWLAAAVIRPLCLQQGPTRLPWQGPMFPTPPDSPDGPSDTEGEEGGRESVEIEGVKKVKRGEGSKRKERRGSFGVKGKSWEENRTEEWGSVSWKPLDSSVACEDRTGSVARDQGWYVCPAFVFCSLAVTLKRAWVRILIGRRHSWAQHN